MIQNPLRSDVSLMLRLFFVLSVDAHQVLPFPPAPSRFDGRVGVCRHMLTGHIDQGDHLSLFTMLISTEVRENHQ
jgi:hypothetical protein